MFKFTVQRKLSEVYPNVFVPLRKIMTVPVTTSSAERRFSRLKLIKTYLRTTTAQQRLTGLTILSTENGVASALDYSEVLGSFSSIKSTERYFYFILLILISSLPDCRFITCNACGYTAFQRSAA
jgi:hypothetical protein